MALPTSFCWTRYGTEAGQTIDQILARKERERLQNNGVFFWGIGNAIGEGLKELLQRCSKPEVVFSPIKSPPRRKDCTPDAVAAWFFGKTLDGAPFRLPRDTVVTSRYDVLSPRSVHYALVCYSEEQLSISKSGDTIELSRLRNVRSSRPLGASQTTAVVKQDQSGDSRDRLYEVTMRAQLVEPYFIRLEYPVRLPSFVHSCEPFDLEASLHRFMSESLSARYLEHWIPQLLPLWREQPKL